MIGDRIVIGKEGTKFYLDGQEVTEKAYRRRHPPPPDDRFELNGQTGDHSGWPMIAKDSLGVHPKQRQEAIDDAVAKGVPTEFTRDGAPILRDRAHRKAYCRAYGFHDNAGGYGDP